MVHFFAAIIALIILLISTAFGVGTIAGGSESIYSCLHKVELKDDEVKARKIKPKYSRKLEDGPRLVYRQRRDRPIFCLHLGQRKLLDAEIEFLTEYGHLSDMVVYAGASPGTHTQILLKMFPHKFELYDPRPITWAHPRMVAYQEYFTNDTAARYTGKKVLFISDIRTGTDDIDMEERDSEIMDNMNQQMEWVNVMQPAFCSLKFRLSWHVPTMEYFDGAIYIQPYAPRSSTETRLWTDGKKTKVWDCKEYEERMYYHNAVARPSWYTLPKKDGNGKVIDYKLVPGIDRCYDCMSEVNILIQYQKSKYPKEMKYIKTVSEMMNMVVELLHQNLDRPPHGSKLAEDLTKREIEWEQKNPDLMCK